MELHIGKEIERKFEESGLKPMEFAKRINTGPRNIYTIFKRKDMNSLQLKKISEALKFDFFSLYQEQLAPAVNEPHAQFRTLKSKESVAVIVQLDGMEETLNYWFGRLKKINSAL